MSSDDQQDGAGGKVGVNLDALADALGIPTEKMESIDKHGAKCPRCDEWLEHLKEMDEHRHDVEPDEWEVVPPEPDTDE